MDIKEQIEAVDELPRGSSAPSLPFKVEKARQYTNTWLERGARWTAVSRW